MFAKRERFFCIGLALFSEDMKLRKFSEAQFKISYSKVWSKNWNFQHVFGDAKVGTIHPPAEALQTLWRTTVSLLPALHEQVISISCLLIVCNH